MRLHPDSGVEDGVFRTAYALRNDLSVGVEDRRILLESLEWFERNLPKPNRFNSSASKGYYRRATRGISWFRDSASECISRMHRIIDILKAQGHEVTKAMVRMPTGPLKQVGDYPVTLDLNADVTTTITVSVLGDTSN